MLKTRFPFLYASTSLDTKAFTIASNRNFESCLSIRCLAPQHIFRFFHFGAGISFASGNFALYCVVLLNAPLSDQDQKKNVSAIHVTFPGKSWSIVIDARRSRCTTGLQFQEARQSPGVAWVVCKPLWTKISYLILGEYNHFERIYMVYRFDWFSSNFARISQE